MINQISDIDTITLYLPTPTTELVNFIISLCWTLLGFYAIYLSFKCNDGFNLLHFLAALFFSPIYMIYMLATQYNKCIKS
jgi:hypothetical protein